MPLQAELRLRLPIDDLQQPAPVRNVPDAALDDVVARVDDVIDGVRHRLLNLWIQDDRRRHRECKRRRRADGRDSHLDLIAKGIWIPEVVLESGDPQPQGGRTAPEHGHRIGEGLSRVHVLVGDTGHGQHRDPL